MAARKGLGALSFSFVEPEAAKEWVDEYYALIESDECVPAGFAVNPNFAVVLPMMCHPDESEAIARGIDGAHFFGYSLAHYYVFGEHRPGVTNIWEEFLANRDPRGFARSIVTPDQAPLGVKLLQEGLGSLRGAVGTPDQIAELVQRYEAAGVDQVIFVLQAGKNRHEHICESIELVGEHVLPRFAETAESSEEAKRERLAGACERALARRAPARVLEDGYVIEPMDEPRPAYASRAATGAGGADGSLGERARAAVESAFGAFVRGRTDEQLDRLMGSGPGLRVIFKGMENAFVPEKAAGFSGEILYDLKAPRGRREWTVKVAGGRVAAEERASAEPAVTLRADVPVFVRIAAGELDPARAMLDGRLEIEGDFAVAGRLGEMFGADPR
jgi:putative sterol carrier protein